MSRFARVYEDPDYEIDEDFDWEDYQEPNTWEDAHPGDLYFTAPSLAPKEDELSPFSTINS